MKKSEGCWTVVVVFDSKSLYLSAAKYIINIVDNLTLNGVNSLEGGVPSCNEYNNNK